MLKSVFKNRVKDGGISSLQTLMPIAYIYVYNEVGILLVAVHYTRQRDVERIQVRMFQQQEAVLKDASATLNPLVVTSPSAS